MNAEPTLTCQICGRVIKAKNGLIAHHGYKRPGHGNQTRSCFGARYRPYEVAHNALDVYLPLLRQWLKDAETALAKWLREPPDTITFQRHYGGYPRGEPIIYKRPENFDAARHAKAGSYSPNTYEGQYTSHAWDSRRTRDYLSAELKDIQARRDAWTPPKGETA